MNNLSNKFELGDIKFEAFGDRVLIEEDEFKSGYECDHCAGTGKARCVNCDGNGTVGERGHKCSYCSGSGSERCHECDGKGGLLVAPDVSQRRPTTGKIVSVGEDTKYLQPGMTVLFSSFAGHTIDLARAGHPISLRILHETEVLSLVEGHLSLKTVRGKSEIAVFQN